MVYGGRRFQTGDLTFQSKAFIAASDFPYYKTLSLISSPPGSQGPRGPLLPIGQEPILGLLTCLYHRFFFQDLWGSRPSFCNSPGRLGGWRGEERREELGGCGRKWADIKVQRMDRDERGTVWKPYETTGRARGSEIQDRERARKGREEEVLNQRKEGRKAEGKRESRPPEPGQAPFTGTGPVGTDLYCHTSNNPTSDNATNLRILIFLGSNLRISPCRICSRPWILQDLLNTIPASISIPRKMSLGMSGK
ncbi:hypothetical protein INR49_030959, partial [Caranx melampygus]